MTPKITDAHGSERMAGVQSPIIPVVGELIRNHPGTISLGQGVVSYGPPPQAFERLTDFYTTPDNHKRRAVGGLPALVAALEAKLRAENGLTVGPGSRVVVSAGG